MVNSVHYDDFAPCTHMIEKKHLIQLANTVMPYGKYAGRVIIDLPEDYLLWFGRKGFPPGNLGDLMALALDIKTHGQEHILDPLRNYPKIH